ncbi:MAG: cysteine--tRNA ligase [Candidatus Babeliales bacterium]
MITITNTLSGKKELFKPIKEGKVSLYVCGITPYDYAHLGHGRVYVSFDVLYRLLTFLGYEVTYCRNFTDIDDKIIARAEKELGDPHKFEQISQKYIGTFHEDIKLLNCLSPKYQPLVTQTMPEIISFVEGLIKQGKAYQSNGDVYFDISSFPHYGRLSKHKLEDLVAGARVEVNEKKKSPLDFALWKHAEPNEPGWESPWGHGRPGWHIECSAMASKFLGDTLDMHAGGLDLIFPHHENEIAQSEALHNKQFVNYWLHNGFVRINQEKMSKSLGNFFTLRDVFKQFDPMVVRFYYLSHHYKAPLDFSFDDLQVARKTYQRLCKVFAIECKLFTDIPLKESPIVKKMIAFLMDDLNVSGMWGVVFESLAELKDQEQLCAVKLFIQQVLGLTLEPLPEKEIEITPEMQELIAERERSRAEKDWKKADELREKLRAMGYEVQDKK